ncbi:MAG: hypothetical protein OES47_10475 [Acidobacteriota bacterium]|nr:hypothetical protein [Acidobacteriota bacterium]
MTPVIGWLPNRYGVGKKLPVASGFMNWRTDSLVAGARVMAVATRDAEDEPGGENADSEDRR